MPYDYPSLIIAITIPIITTIFGAIVTKILSRSQRKLQKISAEYQNKQLQHTSMLEVFKILNNEEHRQAREIVYQGFEKFEKEHHQNIFRSDPYHKKAAMVRADMDQIGLLVVNELVPKDLFLSIYWNTVLICWKALKDNVAEESKRREYPSYMDCFKRLNELAEEHARSIGVDPSKVKVYSDDEERSKEAPAK